MASRTQDMRLLSSLLRSHTIKIRQTHPSLQSSLRCPARATSTSIPSSKERWLKSSCMYKSSNASYSSSTASSTASHPSSNPTSSSTSSSISPSEIAHFSRLASTWWDPQGPSRLLHLMNPLRHEFLSSLLPPSPHPSPPSLTVLDIGTGAGIFAESAARLPQTRSVLGIDPTPSLISAAQAHLRCDPPLASSGKLHYRCCAIEDLPLPSPSPSSDPQAQPQQSSHRPPTSLRPSTYTYNLITLFEVLEHIAHPASFLRRLSTHLAPGGWLLGSTISRSTLSWVTTKLIAEAPWPVGVVPRGTHEWAQYVRPEEMRGWFRGENAGARVRGEPNGGGEGDVRWGEVVIRGCLYVPGLGWRWVPAGVKGSEGWGNYFFGVQRLE